MVKSEAQGALPRCVKCDKFKKPIGRSAPLEMYDSFCDYECEGYLLDPKPTCRWPGELSCGPGCPWGEA